MIDINELGKRAYLNAWKRRKSGSLVEHKKDATSICEEWIEFVRSSEYVESEHLPEYTEAQEELADILIACLTELFKRRVDIEKIITDKMLYNESRKNDK